MNSAELGAGQTERLAGRNAVGGSLLAQGLPRPEAPPQSPDIENDGDLETGPMNLAPEETSTNVCLVFLFVELIFSSIYGLYTYGLL